MEKNKIYLELNEISKKYGGTVEVNCSLKQYNTIGIGGEATALYVPVSLQELKEINKLLNSFDVDSLIIGRGSNLLIQDGNIQAVVINISKGSFSETTFDGTRAVVGAGQHLGAFVYDCCSRGLAGMEGLIGIPGNVGGAVFMNASYDSCISDFLEGVKVLNKDNEMIYLRKEDIKFDYRYSSIGHENIIVETIFNFKEGDPGLLIEKMKNFIRDKIKKQPLDKKTLGCVFKNPKESDLTAGALIDKAGMKGYKYGGLKVSEKHANFIVNVGGAKSSEMVDLMGMIQQKVWDKYSVKLEPEIEIYKF